jgi:hypothetical protein
VCEGSLVGKGERRERNERRKLSSREGKGVCREKGGRNAVRKKEDKGQEREERMEGGSALLTQFAQSAD